MLLGKVKLNFDGVLFKHFSFARIGVILRDAKSEVLMALSRREIGEFEVNEIEALAALQGL